MEKFFSFLVSIITLTSGFSQGLYVSDGTMTVQNNATVTVEGDLFANTNGAVRNSGEVFVLNNIINNSGDVLFLLDSSGTVVLYGNNQAIFGTDSTAFYNLYFDGNVAAEKDFQVASVILNELDLNDQVLKTSDVRTYLLNPDPLSLYFNTGYIASENLGSYFVRATNQIDEYIFPVGRSDLFPSWRPITLTPSNNEDNLFEVRLSPYGPGIDVSGVGATGAEGPFDLADKESNLGQLNTLYYHNINRLEGNSPADVLIEWSNADGEFKSLAQLKSTTFRKLDENLFNTADLGLDKSIKIENQNNFDHDVFVLADLELEIQVPNGVSVNGDGLNDFLIIENLSYFPENKLEIYNRWGDLVYQAQPYENNWEGTSNVSSLGGNQLVGGTYFFVLQLDEQSDPIKGYIELKR